MGSNYYNKEVFNIEKLQTFRLCLVCIVNNLCYDNSCDYKHIFL